MPKRLHAEVSTVVERPIREVFERFADANYSNSVDPSQGYGAKLVSGKPFEKGTVWELLLPGPLGRMTQKQTVCEYESPDHFAVDLVQTGFSGRELWVFSGTEEGAVKVVWTADWTLRWFLRPFRNAVQRKVQSGAEIWIVKMKEAIESDRKAPPPPA